MPRTLFFAVLALSQPVRAERPIREESIVGNGGKTLVCFRDDRVLNEILDPSRRGHPAYGLLRDADISQIASLETLDLYEAKLEDLRYPERGQIFEIRPGESEWDYVARVRARFEAKFPFIRKVIPDRDEIFGQILMAPHSVAPVDDARSGWVHELSSCTTITTALQKKVGDFGQVELDARLYRHPLFSPLSRATLMLHEIVYYTQMHTFGLPKPPAELTSVPTRTLIGFLIQKKLRGIETVGELARQMVKLGYPLKNSDLHPFLGQGRGSWGANREIVTWIRDEIYNGPDFAPWKPATKPAYTGPFFDFSRDFAKAIQSTGLFFSVEAFSSFGQVRDFLDRALASGRLYRAGDCIHWDFDGQNCSGRAQKDEPPFDAAFRRTLQKFRDRLDPLAKRQVEFKRESVARFEANFRKYLEDRIPAGVIEANGHAPELNERVRRLWVDEQVRFWSFHLFASDVLPAEKDYMGEGPEPVPKRLRFWAAGLEEEIGKAILKLVMDQRFEAP